MIHAGWFVAAVLLGQLSTVVVVGLFLRAQRPLVRAVAAETSADLVQLEAVAERPKVIKAPKRRRNPPEVEVDFADSRPRPMGL